MIQIKRWGPDGQEVLAGTSGAMVLESDVMPLLEQTGLQAYNLTLELRGALLDLVRTQRQLIDANAELTALKMPAAPSVSIAEDQQFNQLLYFFRVAEDNYRPEQFRRLAEYVDDWSKKP